MQLPQLIRIVYGDPVNVNSEFYRSHKLEGSVNVKIVGGIVEESYYLFQSGLILHTKREIKSSLFI